MTRIKMKYDGGMISGFSLEGHAEYDKSGKDIVCAAISATSQMVIMGILDFTGMQRGDIVVVEDAKTATIMVNIPKELNKYSLQTLLKAFDLMCMSMHNEYPQNVSYEGREEV